MSRTRSVPLPTTRALRALALYEAHGHRIQDLGEGLFRVPSQDGQRSYVVRYGEVEACACPDHLYRCATCVHILAVGIYCAKHRIRPELVAGDPFAAAGSAACHCYEGWVYLGFEGEDEDGNPCEEIERVPCRRCSGNSR